MRISRPGSINLATAIGLAIALAGCGGGGTDGNDATASVAAPSGWDATNACALIDQKAVATMLGTTIEKSTLGAVKKDGGGFPLYSQCEILFKDGRMLVFGTGQATNGETLDTQVADMRRQSTAVSPKPAVDVPGLGKAALWAESVHSLYAFLGDGRYVSATLMQTDFRKPADPIDKIKADVTAILHKAGA